MRLLGVLLSASVLVSPFTDGVKLQKRQPLVVTNVNVLVKGAAREPAMTTPAKQTMHFWVRCVAKSFCRAYAYGQANESM